MSVSASLAGLLSRLLESIPWTKSPPPPEEIAPPVKPPSGEGRRIRAVAFSGGGLNTANQLGFIHALLVAKCRPPELVAGISAGAVNAVTLAEVLRAGKSTDDEPDRVAQVARFREIFEAVRSFPGEFFTQMIPDPFEVNARAPLKPQTLPIHFEKERAERLETTQARFGLIRLFNDLLRTTVPISTFTRVVRHILEIRMLGEAHWPQRLAGQIWHGIRLWFIFGVNIPRLAALITRLVLGVWFAKMYHRLLQATVTSYSVFQRFYRTPLLKVLQMILWLVAFPTPGTAQGIMRGRNFGKWLDPIRHGLGGIILAAWWLIMTLTPFYPYACSRGWMAVEEKFPLQVMAVAWLAAWYVYRRYSRGLDSLRQIFSSYDLDKDLATPFAVKPFLVRHFDPDYYGKGDINQIQKSALSGLARPPKPKPTSPKRLECYSPEPDDTKTGSAKPRIHVFPLVADLRTGKLLPVAGTAKVVDALLAAGAVVPFFRPRQIDAILENGKIGEISAIDGLNISNEPMLALFSLLAYLYKKRDPIVDAPGDNPFEHQIECYPVTALPFNPPTSQKGGCDRLPLSDVVKRAVDLQRFRDAELGGRMVDLVHRVMPEGVAFYGVPNEVPREKQFVYVRSSVFPIRTDDFQNLNQRVLLAESDGEQRRIIAEGIADGCRAGLEVLLADTIIRNTANEDSVLDCSVLLAKRLKDGEQLPGSEKSDPTKQNTASVGPGIPEVCRYCVRKRGTKEEKARSLGRLKLPPTVDGNPRPLPERDWPKWEPQSRSSSAGAATNRQKEKASGTTDVETTSTTATPDPAPEAATKPPAISMLFSGGVFRGVFQVGVLAALEQIKLRPHIIAGASVGSIMSAMAAQIFVTTDAAERRRLLLEVSATFLCIDRLVITDRFSDFVRRFTVRASETEFSLHDVDSVFRLFDRPSADEFSEDARRVLAGLERLFYLSPFELKDLARAIRSGKRKQTDRRLRGALQRFLDQSAVGQEILGAEPLALLLKHHVLDKGVGQKHTFARFLQSEPTEGLDRIHLLATVTNLTQGRLDVLGLKLDEAAGTDLRNGLLASSAFPGVFRPRWSWEVRTESNCADQYIDGGVMDNLPVTAAIDFLKASRIAGKIDRTGFDYKSQQGAPHLMFTASLEADTPPLDNAKLERAEKFWVQGCLRAKQLRYNKKITDFARAQDNLRVIVREREAAKDKTLAYDCLPLDIAVVCVKPKWLCGTFGFHPMLGFRRAKQAESIAHGCASTFAKLALVQKKHPDWIRAWGIDDAISKVKMNCIVARNAPHDDEVETLKPDKGAKLALKEGRCWLRENEPCPFSRRQLDEQDVSAEQIDALSAIHCACVHRETHAPKDD